MSRFAIAAFSGAFLLAPLAGTSGAPSAPIVIADATRSAPLTLTTAKRQVTRWLADSGQHRLRAGTAAFDRDGNVTVDVVDPIGISVQHVVVDASTGLVAAARLTKKSAHAID